MKLLDILHQRIDSLVAGHHTAGIRSVIQHVQVAIAHLERGKREGDDTAFTDAIYRTNQAFEGSLKEAYRVLASKDPGKNATPLISRASFRIRRSCVRVYYRDSRDIEGGAFFPGSLDANTR